MKIANTNEMAEHLLTIMNNTVLTEQYSAASIVGSPAQTVSGEDADRIADQIQEALSAKGTAYTHEEALVAALALVAMAADFPVPVNVNSPAWKQMIRESRVFPENSFQQNPYLQAMLLIPQVERGHFALNSDVIFEKELFEYQQPAAWNGIWVSRIGLFEHNLLHYPTLKKNGQVFRAVTPYEILTMEGPIREAAGNVLTLGCGIGYFAYMASEKDTVSHVTIVEEDPDLLELFRTYLLPEFPHPERITLIQEDPAAYMESLADGIFDFCFAQAWGRDADFIPYLRLKKCCGRFQKMKLSYWIEDALAARIQGIMALMILRDFFEQGGFPLPRFMESMPVGEEELSQFLWRILDGVNIATPEQVDFYLDVRNLIPIVR